MHIRGYETSIIQADAAFTSDFAIPDDIPIQRLVNMLEIERRSMDIRPGMRHKYTPLRFDPATGAHQVGGRYLFDTWENVVDYNEFTSKELEFEPGVKFWDRPFSSVSTGTSGGSLVPTISRRWPLRTTSTGLSAGHTPVTTLSDYWNKHGQQSARTPRGKAWPVSGCCSARGEADRHSHRGLKGGRQRSS